MGHSNLKSTVKSPFKVRTYNSIQEYTSYTTQPPKCLPNLRSSSSSLPTTRWATQESPLDGTCPNSPTHTTFSHHTPKSASPLPPAAPHPSILLSRSFERRRCVREVFEGERKSLEADREAGQLPRTGGRV